MTQSKLSPYRLKLHDKICFQTSSNIAYMSVLDVDHGEMERSMIIMMMSNC